jgi:transcriptional regulator with XRE-family HTH domain
MNRRTLTVGSVRVGNRESVYRLTPLDGRKVGRVRGMTDDMTIGQRVAFYRRRRGLSQDVLAGLVGRTAEWLRKVETNRADLDRLSVIRTLATALDVPLGDLIGEPSLFEWTEGSGHRTIPALRTALRDYRHLSPAMARTDAEQPPPLADLEHDVAGIWRSYQHSRYGDLARHLPGLINACLTAARGYDGDAARHANALAGYAHHVTTLFLTKLGDTDLAWIAASRGLAAANASGDPVVIGSLSRAAAHALTANGEYHDAREVARAAAGYLQPHLNRPTPALLSVYGSLHLMCALAAARDNDRAASRTHLAEADDSARRLGGDANHVWTAFGPTNVTIHQVCVALELGDVQRALAIGPHLDTTALPVERQVRHAIEVARALARHNRIDDALAALLDAERIGPDQVRYHALSRILVREILTRPRPPRLALDLSHRMGLHTTPHW